MSILSRFPRHLFESCRVLHDLAVDCKWPVNCFSLEIVCILDVTYANVTEIKARSTAHAKVSSSCCRS